MRTFQGFISEAFKAYKNSIGEMYDQPMPRAPSPTKPNTRSPESIEGAKREQNLPNPTKLTKTKRDIKHQKELERKALENIGSGKPSVGKSLEQMKAELKQKRIDTFGSNNPMRHRDEPEEYAGELPRQPRQPRPRSSQPPAPPRKVKKTPPPSPVKKKD